MAKLHFALLAELRIPHTTFPSSSVILENLCTAENPPSPGKHHKIVTQPVDLHRRVVIAFSKHPSMHKLFFTATLLIIACTLYAQKIYNIWPGVAPGSENWSWQEARDSIELAKGDLLAYNIVQPTLTFFPADASISNGACVIICPGGSFCYLHINTEGADVAKWLNKIGVSAFVLQYRLVHMETNLPIKEKNERAKDTINSRKLVAALIPLAIADGKRAIAYVRENASMLNVSPNKIGIMGFSAGGTVATAAAFNYSDANKPDFVGMIYAYVPRNLPMAMQPDSPPAFIAAATDDELHLVPTSVDMYNKWLDAHIDAELHIYQNGGHGFGMNKKNLPVDTWINRFGDWMQSRGLLNK
jgi:acetyl esterase/lipase